MNTTPLFLTDEEVVRLTGYRRPHKQIDWLNQQRLRHWIAADGYPRVPRASIDGTATTQASHDRREGPRLEGLASRRQNRPP